MLRVDPIHLTEGNWRYGWALDWHTIRDDSAPEGYVRTEIGQALYELKYQNDLSQIDFIAEKAAQFLKTRKVTPYLAAIIPVPPSDLSRDFQPVSELATEIGKRVGLKVDHDYLKKVRQTPGIKDIEEYQDRLRLLEGAFRVVDMRYRGKKLLVFDDLYRSGATLRTVTEALLDQGGVDRVFVLTITKTRSLR